MTTQAHPPGAHRTGTDADRVPPGPRPRRAKPALTHRTGNLLGRYWEIGPQHTLYLPRPFLRTGDNTLTVLELERLGDRIELVDRPELGAPEEYIETFD